jgi:hypothetical protein
VDDWLAGKSLPLDAVADLDLETARHLQAVEI